MPKGKLQNTPHSNWFLKSTEMNKNQPYLFYLFSSRWESIFSPITQTNEFLDNRVIVYVAIHKPFGGGHYLWTNTSASTTLEV